MRDLDVCACMKSREQEATSRRMVLFIMMLFYESMQRYEYSAE
jgi:hypothetical protein